MHARNHRILALDGGGSWAVVQAKVLGELYGHDTDGWSILDRFDFAAANSGGAIVLALLLNGLTPKSIAATFRDRRKREHVFDRNTIVDRAIGGLLGVGPRYHAPAKLNGLIRIFDESEGRFGREFTAMTLDRIAGAINADRRTRRLGPFHFLITAFDFDVERAAFFRSDPDSKAASFRSAPMPTIANALHATTNAPLRYYNRPAEVVFGDGTVRHYWDGAVGGYNNPIVAGVVEALAADQRRREAIVVLSLGTGNTRLPVVAPEWPGAAAHVVRSRRARGPDSVRFISDLRKMSAAIMAERPDSATYMAHLMLGEAGHAILGAPVTETRIVRMNPMIQPRHAGLDADGHARWEPYEWFAEPSAGRGRTLFERLASLDMDAMADDEIRDIERLADLWLAGKVPNQAILADDRLVPEIGHGWFAEALAQWRALESPPAIVPAAEPRAAQAKPLWPRLVRWLKSVLNRPALPQAPAPAASGAPRVQRP